MSIPTSSTWSTGMPTFRSCPGVPDRGGGRCTARQASGTQSGRHAYQYADRPAGCRHRHQPSAPDPAHACPPLPCRITWSRSSNLRLTFTRHFSPSWQTCFCGLPLPKAATGFWWKLTASTSYCASCGACVRPVLADYAITPDVFDVTSYTNDEICRLHLKQIGNVMRTEGLVRDLRAGSWRALVADGERPWPSPRQGTGQETRDAGQTDQFPTSATDRSR